MQSCKHAEGWHAERDHSGAGSADVLPAPGHGRAPGARLLHLALWLLHLKGLGEAQRCQLSLLYEKLKEASGPQPRALLLTNKLPWHSTGLFLFYTDCDLLWARGKVPNDRPQNPCIAKPSTTSLSRFGSKLFLPFLKQHDLHIILLGTYLPQSLKACSDHRPGISTKSGGQRPRSVLQ